MPATLVWGKGFRIERSILISGEEHAEVFGIDGGHEPISWVSIEEIEKIAEGLGIGPDLWPIYRDCEIDLNIPFDDAENRSSKLRAKLEEAEADSLKDNHWLSIILRILKGGNSFFIMP